jgi:hypothetical protein
MHDVIALFCNLKGGVGGYRERRDDEEAGWRVI